MIKPLLTIAIPTWNRANILNKALKALLGQLEKNNELIEIIISDNCSSDNTDQIIREQILRHKTLNITHFKHHENTGYFGNFQKCRELSNGEYFWLLSDNDHVANGLIDYLLSVLITDKPSFIYLKDWVHANKIRNKEKFDKKPYSINNALLEFNYRLTLISAVIFKNEKKKDDVLFNQFKGNTFIGFAYFLQSLKAKNIAIEVIGTSLYIHDSKVSFNAFKSFTIDLVECLEFSKKENVLSESIVETMVNSVISELTIKHYILFRVTGQLHGKKYEKNYIDSLIFNGFSNYTLFIEELEPLINLRGFNFYKRVITKHLFKIIKQRLLR